MNQHALSTVRSLTAYTAVLKIISSYPHALYSSYHHHREGGTDVNTPVRMLTATVAREDHTGSTSFVELVPTPGESLTTTSTVDAHRPVHCGVPDQHTWPAPRNSDHCRQPGSRPQTSHPHYRSRLQHSQPSSIQNRHSPGQSHRYRAVARFSWNRLRSQSFLHRLGNSLDRPMRRIQGGVACA